MVGSLEQCPDTLPYLTLWLLCCCSCTAQCSAVLPHVDGMVGRVRRGGGRGSYAAGMPRWDFGRRSTGLNADLLAWDQKDNASHQRAHGGHYQSMETMFLKEFFSIVSSCTIR